MFEHIDSNVIIEGDITQLLEKKKDSGWVFSNILILTSSFLNYEGASKVVENQYLSLSKKYNVKIFTFLSNYDKYSFDFYLVKSVFLKVPLLNVVYKALFFSNVFKLVHLLFKVKKYDIIIVHQGTWVTLAYLSKMLLGKKIIFFNHHVANDEMKSTPNLLHSNNKIDFIMRLYNNIFWNYLCWPMVRKFDYVISVSKYSRYVLFNKTGIDSVVIYNQIDGRFIKGLDSTKIRNKYNLNQDPLILFVGRILPHKGIHKLIEAFSLVMDEISNAKLIIVGKHYDVSYSNQLLNKDNNIIFEQSVSDEDLPYYYAACTVYATCSVIEGFNLPLIEAQACGKPVVAFDIGPHKEVVKNGVLVKENDISEFAKQLIKLLKNTPF